MWSAYTDVQTCSFRPFTHTCMNSVLITLALALTHTKTQKHACMYAHIQCATLLLVLSHLSYLSHTSPFCLLSPGWLSVAVHYITLGKLMLLYIWWVEVTASDTQMVVWCTVTCINSYFQQTATVVFFLSAISKHVHKLKRVDWSNHYPLGALFLSAAIFWVFFYTHSHTHKKSPNCDWCFTGWIFMFDCVAGYVWGTKMEEGWGSVLPKYATILCVNGVAVSWMFVGKLIQRVVNLLHWMWIQGRCFFIFVLDVVWWHAQIGVWSWVGAWPRPSKFTFVSFFLVLWWLILALFFVK